MEIRRRGFTLVELLITILVIGIMASMLGFALFAAQETAKVHKTKSLIAKLDSIIKAKYETYKTRRVPITIGADTFTDLNGNNAWDASEPLIADWNGNGVFDFAQDACTPQQAAKIRLDTLRDIMRLEMPDRWSDVEDNPVTPFPSTQKISRPSVSQGFYRQWSTGAPSNEAQGAECLYLVVMHAQQEDADDRSVIKPDQIKDTDLDGFPEIVDAWDQPIRFLRWAPGFVSELQVTMNAPSLSATATTVTAQDKQLSSTSGNYVGGALINEDPANPGSFLPASMARITGYSYTAGTGSFDVVGAPGFSLTAPGRFFVTAPDPFDPRRVYPMATRPVPSFALYPLIYSGGPNKCTGIVTDTGAPHHYAADGVNPFFLTPSSEMIGNQRDIPAEANFVSRAWTDNIHNHMITAR